MYKFRVSFILVFFIKKSGNCYIQILYFSKRSPSCSALWCLRATWWPTSSRRRWTPRREEEEEGSGESSSNSILTHVYLNGKCINIWLLAYPPPPFRALINDTLLPPALARLVQDGSSEDLLKQLIEMRLKLILIGGKMCVTFFFSKKVLFLFGVRSDRHSRRHAPGRVQVLRGLLLPGAGGEV